MRIVSMSPTSVEAGRAAHTGPGAEVRLQPETETPGGGGDIGGMETPAGCEDTGRRQPHRPQAAPPASGDATNQR
ncbi:hypothetical protein GCM10017687_07520 [Streptomyces echinatus]